MGRVCGTYGEKKNTYMVMEDLAIGARIILKWISYIYIYDGRMQIGIIWLRIRTSGWLL
jgi:hypothetical protein